MLKKKIRNNYHWFFFKNLFFKICKHLFLYPTSDKNKEKKKQTNKPLSLADSLLRNGGFKTKSTLVFWFHD